MWKVASENLRFENFLLDCYRSKNFPELKTAFGQNKSILSWFSRFFIITPRKLAKQYFLSFFFPDHFSVVSGGNKWSKNWRQSCCKQIKVTKVTNCVQSQQCTFWTLFDIFAPKFFKFACCLGGLTIGFVKIIIKQNLSKNCTSCLTSQKKSSGNLMNLG